jgi:hypothetical protein
MDEKSYQLSKVVIFEATGRKNRLKDKSSAKVINSLIILIIHRHKNCRLTFWRVCMTLAPTEDDILHKDVIMHMEPSHFHFFTFLVYGMHQHVEFPQSKETVCLLSNFSLKKPSEMEWIVHFSKYNFSSKKVFWQAKTHKKQHTIETHTVWSMIVTLDRSTH